MPGSGLDPHPPSREPGGAEERSTSRRASSWVTSCECRRSRHQKKRNAKTSSTATTSGKKVNGSLSTAEGGDDSRYPPWTDATRPGRRVRSAAVLEAEVRRDDPQQHERRQHQCHGSRLAHGPRVATRRCARRARGRPAGCRRFAGRTLPPRRGLRPATLGAVMHRAAVRAVPLLLCLVLTGLTAGCGGSVLDSYQVDATPVGTPTGSPSPPSTLAAAGPAPARSPPPT